MYDLIGDIHGYADELDKLLHKLGYSEISGVYRSPLRRILFVNDSIDRGPKIEHVLHIARSMLASGSALC